MVTVTGIFDAIADAQSAAQALSANGWARESISVVSSQPSGGGRHDHSLTIKDAEKGAAIGGLAGLFIGMTELAVPGVGLILVGGWLVAILLGAGLGAAVGGLAGALVEAGIGHKAASELAESIQQGSTLVIVKSEADRAGEAAALLQQHHAASVEEHPE